MCTCLLAILVEGILTQPLRSQLDHRQDGGEIQDALLSLTGAAWPCLRCNKHDTERSLLARVHGCAHQLNSCWVAQVDAQCLASLLTVPSSAVAMTQLQRPGMGSSSSSWCPRASSEASATSCSRAACG